MTVRSISFRQAWLAAGLSVLSLATGGCFGLKKRPDASGAGQVTSAGVVSQSALSAFQSSFYAFARTNCASCHGTTQVPAFALPDVTAAYSNARDPQYIDFNHPESSMYANYAGNGHCGVSNCSGNTAAAIAQLKTWAAAELAAAQSGKPGAGSGSGSGPSVSVSLTYLSQPLAIPSPLPTPGATFAAMRWPLASLTPVPPGAGKAIFELEIEQLSATNYHLRNPKIAGLAAAMEVKGLHVMIKKSTDGGTGSEQPLATEWTLDDAVVKPSTLPSPLPTTPLTTKVTTPFDTNGMVLPVLSSNDMLTVGFDNLLPATTTTITPSFSAINSQILQPSCVSCHKVGNANGNVDLSSYTAVMTQVVSGNPAGSPLYTSVAGGGANMPQGASPLSSAAISAISTWITNGAPNN